MKDSAMLGELLYVISDYEKGRINTSKLWNKRYKTSLKNSLYIMRIIIAKLTNETVSCQETELLCKFIKSNIGVIFPEPIMNFDVLADKLFECQISKELIDTYAQINNLVRQIVAECDYLISSKGRNYKQKLIIY